MVEKRRLLQVASPLLFEFALLLLAFVKDARQYLFSVTERNLKRIFPFTKKKKRQKAKILFRICFVAACSREVCRGAPPSSLLGDHAGISAVGQPPGV